MPPQTTHHPNLKELRKNARDILIRNIDEKEDKKPNKRDNQPFHRFGTQRTFSD